MSFGGPLPLLGPLELGKWNREGVEVEGEKRLVYGSVGVVGVFRKMIGMGRLVGEGVVAGGAKSIVVPLHRVFIEN